MGVEVLVDFENIIKKYKVLKFDKVWEKHDSNFKLIYNIEGLVVDNKFYAVVKLIFWLDGKKEKITEDVITYLYTLSCDYKSITFTTIGETFDSILKQLDNERTNKELSEFIVNGTDAFNKELKINKINSFIQTLNFMPQGNVPCVSMKFMFGLVSNDKTYEFQLKPMKDGWQLTYENNEEMSAMTEVPKKIIDWIYDIKRDNI